MRLKTLFIGLPSPCSNWYVFFGKFLFNSLYHFLVGCHFYPQSFCKSFRYSVFKPFAITLYESVVCLFTFFWGKGMGWGIESLLAPYEIT